MADESIDQIKTLIALYRRNIRHAQAEQNYSKIEYNRKEIRRLKAEAIKQGFKITDVVSIDYDDPTVEEHLNDPIIQVKMRLSTYNAIRKIVADFGIILPTRNNKHDQ